MEVLSFRSICLNNSLIIFDALPSNELATAARLESDVTDYSRAIDREGYCNRLPIKNKAILIAHLNVLLRECQAGVLKPILHFEAHGHEVFGLHIHESNEYISWEELMRYTREINAASGNNTTLVIAACHGYAISNFIVLDAPCPFNTLIAPTEEVSAGYFLDAMLPFYKEVMTTGNLIVALTHLNEKMQRFVSSEYFYKGLASFFIGKKSAKRRAELVEELVTNVMSGRSSQDRNSMRLARKSIKQTLKKPAGLFKHMSQTFLHGAALVTFEQFWRFVQQAHSDS